MPGPVQKVRIRSASVDYWHVATDGTFDDTQEQAVQVLQHHCGLMQTGVVDVDTWHALERWPLQQAEHHADQHAEQHAEAASGGGGSHPTLRKGISSDWVVHLQQVMQHVGL